MSASSTEVRIAADRACGFFEMFGDVGQLISLRKELQNPAFAAEFMLHVSRLRKAWRQEFRPTEDLENQKPFTCPACGGHHCGVETARTADGQTVVLDQVRCHDEREVGCKWYGRWDQAGDLPRADFTGCSAAKLYSKLEVDNRHLKRTLHRRRRIIATLRAELTIRRAAAE